MQVKIFQAHGAQLFGLAEAARIDTPVPPVVGDVIIVTDGELAFRVIAVVHFAPLNERQVIGQRITQLDARLAAE